MKHFNSPECEYLGFFFPTKNNGFLMPLDLKHYFFVAIFPQKDAENPKTAAITGFNQFVTNKGAKYLHFLKFPK